MPPTEAAASRENQALEELLELAARWLRRPVEGGLGDGRVRDFVQLTRQTTAVLLRKRRDVARPSSVRASARRSQYRFGVPHLGIDDEHARPSARARKRAEAGE